MSFEKRWLAVITYCDRFLFQIYSSSNTKSQASSFFFAQDYKVCIFFALEEKQGWNRRGMRRKTKTKIKFLHKSQIPSTLGYGKWKKQLKELKLGCYMNFFSCFREQQPYRTQVTAKISLVSQRLERKVKIRTVEEYNTLGSLTYVGWSQLCFAGHFAVKTE